jgi:hypothetical protein
LRGRIGAVNAQITFLTCPFVSIRPRR